MRQALQKPPRQSGLKVGRWSSKRVAAYLKKTFGQPVHLDTARGYIGGPSWNEDPRGNYDLQRGNIMRTLSIFLPLLITVTTAAGASSVNWRGLFWRTSRVSRPNTQKRRPWGILEI